MYEASHELLVNRL